LADAARHRAASRARPPATSVHAARWGPRFARYGRIARRRAWQAQADPVILSPGIEGNQHVTHLQDLQAGGPPAFAPIDAAQRIQALDVIRGFALLGIFLMNIEWFSRPLQEMG